MSDDIMYKYLNEINYPEDLRKLSIDALPQVSEEVREFIIDTITKTGGHFGAGLGVVELTVALHYVYNTPKDKIVIDTGHQGYPHKVLTGRKDALRSIRQMDGLSGFLKRTESEYDVFGAGHASTSISAALGIATARDFNEEDYKVIAMIGDGAMTGGLAFEAMNNCGVQQRDMLVIMNDNQFSIAPNVSAISNYFNDIYTNETVQKIRNNIWDFAGKFDVVGDGLGDRFRKLAGKIEHGVKAIVTPGVLFEALGFNYIGPVNGHNVKRLVSILNSIKHFKGPVFLHVVTQKGYGYKYATRETKFMHAIGKIDKITGKSTEKKSVVTPPPNYQDVFGGAVNEILANDKKVVAITAAMPEGTGLNIPQKDFPERVIDVGIAEGHAVTFAAGLATQGIIPIVAIYSTFLQRAYDHIIHDVALQNQHVVFALDRSGLVGADGATHHGVMDLAYLRSIPNMVLMAPKDEQELRDMLWSAIYDYKEYVVAIRFPRGAGLGAPLTKMNSIELGKSETIKSGKHIAVLALGKMLEYAIEAVDILGKEGISVELVNARFVKPLDTVMLDSICAKFENIITIEDGQKQGGFGSAVAEYFIDKQLKNNLIVMGIEDEYVTHGTQAELHRLLELDAEGIVKKVREVFINHYVEA